MAIHGDIKGNGSDQIEEGIPLEAMDDDDNDQDESSEDDYLDDEEVDDEDEDEDDEEAAEGEVIRRTYVPNANNADMDVDGEGDGELECDLSAYVMYHKAETGYPCLSFDIIADANNSPDRVNTFPQTAYLVGGTNADKAHLNKLLILKLSQMGPVKNQSENDDELEDLEDEDEELPDLQSVSIAHSGCVNRIRARTIGDRTVAATFSELGVVHLWDLSNPLAAIEDASAVAKWNKHQEKNPQKAIFSFAGHNIEGYAIDWSPTVDGRLATGDCRKNIFLWNLAEGGWVVDQAPLTGHTASVEDLQWSPNEENILASCSVDRSLRVWDIRMKASAAIDLPSVHNADVNVISWNKLEKAFILSGADDGVVKVWDLRYVRKGGSASGGDSSSTTCKPVATFKHHQEPITSVEWHPNDGTVFAASSDDQITLWDLAVEADADAAVQDGAGAGGSGEDGQVKTADDKEVAKLPPQLLFIHQGQKEVKEVHWHEQLPGVLISTAMNGFDIFRTISV